MRSRCYPNDTSTFCRSWEITRQWVSKPSPRMTRSNSGGMAEVLETTRPAPSLPSDLTVQSITERRSLNKIEPLFRTLRRSLPLTPFKSCQDMQQLRPPLLAAYIAASACAIRVSVSRLTIERLVDPMLAVTLTVPKSPLTRTSAIAIRNFSATANAADLSTRGSKKANSSPPSRPIKSPALSALLKASLTALRTSSPAG